MVKDYGDIEAQVRKSRQEEGRNGQGRPGEEANAEKNGGTGKKSGCGENEEARAEEGSPGEKALR